jgi:hypothetical protein
MINDHIILNIKKNRLMSTLTVHSFLPFALTNLSQKFFKIVFCFIILFYFYLLFGLNFFVIVFILFKRILHSFRLIFLFFYVFSLIYQINSFKLLPHAESFDFVKSIHYNCFLFWCQAHRQWRPYDVFKNGGNKLLIIILLYLTLNKCFI